VASQMPRSVAGKVRIVLTSAAYDSTDAMPIFIGIWWQPPRAADLHHAPRGQARDRVVLDSGPFPYRALYQLTAA
jgi:hypothetical protein